MFFRFAVALLFLSGAASAQEARKAPKVLSTEGGRYVLGQISEMGVDKYLLDTKTGRVWQMQMDRTKSKDGVESENIMLVPLLFLTPAKDLVRDAPTSEPVSK